MKVAVITNSMDGRRTGIGNYTRGLVQALVDNGHGNDLILIHSERSNDPLYKQATEKVIPNLPRNVFEFGKFLREIKCDVVHFPSFTGSQLPLYFATGMVPIVVTMHDITPILYPEAHPIKSGLLWGRALKFCSHRIAHWISVSENTKLDMEKYLKIDGNDISVTYTAADPRFKFIRDKEAARNYILNQYGLKDPFILYVGTLEPRKNIPTLIHAFAMVKKDGFPQKLLLIGGKGWKYEKVFSAINELSLADQIVIPGYVPDEDLVYFYNVADLFVYPSVYEGFGFPPLEAMACGTPVITSNKSSLPEVAGDAALLVNPLDVRALAGAIERVLANEELRAELSERGLKRAKFFDWKKTAERTWEVYGVVGDRGDIR